MRVLTVLTPILLLPLASCGTRDASGAARWSGTIDTLPSGRVAVTNPATGIWDSASAWRVEEDLRIGTMDGSGPDLFGRITDLAVDRAGRVWVFEGQAQELRVFDATGRHVRTIGRKGGGPGEFSQVMGMAWGPGGRLWVVDPQNNRVSIIDTSGAFVRSHTIAGGFIIMPWPGGFDQAGRFYNVVPVRSEEGFRTALVRYDTAMTPIDTVQRPRYEGPQEYFELRSDGGFMRAGVPFSSGLSAQLHPDAKFWALSTGDYRLLEISLTGDTLRTITRAFEPLPVTEADIDAAIEDMEWFTRQGGKVDRSKFPGTKPPVTSFAVDDVGNIWVACQDDDAPGDRVDVFDGPGRYLGRIRLPFETQWGRLPIFRDEVLYTVTRDALEVPYVVRARIVKPERP